MLALNVYEKGFYTSIGKFMLFKVYCSRNKSDTGACIRKKAGRPLLLIGDIKEVALEIEAAKQFYSKIIEL
jgi:hypothetical protein